MKSLPIRLTPSIVATGFFNSCINTEVIGLISNGLWTKTNNQIQDTLKDEVHDFRYHVREHQHNQIFENYYQQVAKL